MFEVRYVLSALEKNLNLPEARGLETRWTQHFVDPTTSHHVPSLSHDGGGLSGASLPIAK